MRIVANLSLNLSRLCVMASIAYCLSRDAIDLVLDHRRQIAPSSLDDDTEGRRTLAFILGACQFLAQFRQQLFKIALDHLLRTQFLNHVLALRDCFFRTSNRALYRLFCPLGISVQQVLRSLELKHYPVKILEQGVMQLSCDSCPLPNSLFQSDRELPGDLTHPQVMELP